MLRVLQGSARRPSPTGSVTDIVYSELITFCATHIVKFIHSVHLLLVQIIHLLFVNIQLYVSFIITLHIFDVLSNKQVVLLILSFYPKQN